MIEMIEMVEWDDDDDDDDDDCYVRLINSVSILRL